MANIHDFLNRYQLQYRPTSALHKVVVAAAILLSSVTLFAIRMGTMDARDRLAALEARAAQLEQANIELVEDIAALGTSDSVREIAREELGLVDPDTIIIEQAD